MAWEVSSDAGQAGKNTDDSGAISDAPGLPASLVPVPPTPAPAPPTLILPPVPGPAKVQVVVRDVAYVTYKAFLYYVSKLVVVCRSVLTMMDFQLYTGMAAVFI